MIGVLPRGMAHNSRIIRENKSKAQENSNPTWHMSHQGHVKKAEEIKGDRIVKKGSSFCTIKTVRQRDIRFYLVYYSSIRKKCSLNKYLTTELRLSPIKKAPAKAGASN